jgi:RNA polymerase sigma-70 factor, ECF subfamily
MSGPIDRHTVDQLVIEHLPTALRFAQRLTNDPETASDVVQEALCRVLARWKTFRGESTFRTWLLQIVLNVDRDRRRRRHEELRPPPDEVVCRAAGPNEQAAATELGDTIRSVIDSLPERQREVAILSFGEGLAAADVAYILNTTEANVHTCIHLARRRIAEAIGYDFARPKSHGH